MHYRKTAGAEQAYYHPHYDSRRLFVLADSERADLQNKDRTLFPHAARFATVLHFLNKPRSGGNTTFPLARASIAPLVLTEVSALRLVVCATDACPDLERCFFVSDCQSLRSKNPQAKALWDAWGQQCDSSGPALSFAPQIGEAILWWV
eukprot:SAG11_NODE_747_length_7366_cov_7.215632_4_plen_149_part_00